MVIALNMSDEAQKEGIEIDETYMSQLLNVPCVKVSAATKMGIENLIDTVLEVNNQPKQEPKLIFSEAVEEEIEKIVHFLKANHFQQQTPIEMLRLTF